VPEINISAGNVTLSPTVTDTAVPVSVFPPVLTDEIVALFSKPVVVAVISSPELPFTHVFANRNFAVGWVAAPQISPEIVTPFPAPLAFKPILQVAPGASAGNQLGDVAVTGLVPVLSAFHTLVTVVLSE